MADYVYPFHDLPEGRTAGSKGATLGRLLRAGFPVPQGVVVVAEAYLAHLQAHGMEPSIQELLSATDLQDPRGMEVGSSRIQQLILGQPIPREVEEELRREYRALWDSCAGGVEPVAVRSSATLEDLAGSSFAGQYATYLNVVDEESLLARVRECWASLWTPRAMHYRARLGPGETPVAMAVVVQEMVAATASGVAFTADPVTGHPQRMVINATWGLGEGVVTGSVTGDLYTVDKDSLTPLTTVIGDKASAVVAQADGHGTTLTATEPGRRREPALAPHQLQAIAGLARDIETALGGPQDIEWSLHGDQPYILQSRPITVGVAQGEEQSQEEEFPLQWADPEDRQHHWQMNFITSGMKQEPFVPLETDLRTAWFRGRQNALKLGGGAVSRQNQLLVFNGYPYVRSSTCGLSDEEVAARARQLQLQEYLARKTNMWEAEVLPEVQSILSTVFPVPSSDSGIPQLQEYLERVLIMYERLWTLHWLMGMGGGPGWPELFVEITGSDDPLAALELLQGQPNKTTELMDGLLRLVHTVNTSSSLESLFRETDEADLMAALEARPEARDFLERLEEFLEAFGYRTGTSLGSVARLPTPPWRQDPALVFSVIKRYLDQDIPQMQASQKARDREREELLASVRAQLQDRPEALARFEGELTVWRGQAARMENHNFYIDQVSSALAHIAFRRIGDALHVAGALADPEEVFVLTLEDLRHAADPAWSAAFREKVRERQTLYAWCRRLSPPPWVGAPPPSLPQDAQAGAPQPPAEEEPVLRGMPTVRGRHTGRARVITNPEVVPQVEKGDILVALNAGEQWTPIFPVLGALVLDEGSILQHAAIVAREYGIPAVLQCKDATRRIRDGQTITVDGSLGIVEPEI